MTYRWQRRMFGAVVCALLACLMSILFQTHSTWLVGYVLFGGAKLFFALSSIIFFISAIFYRVTGKTLAPKNLIDTED